MNIFSECIANTVPDSSELVKKWNKQRQQSVKYRVIIDLEGEKIREK